MRSLLTLPLSLAVLAGCSRGESFRTDQGTVWTTGYTVTYRCGKPLNDSILNQLRIVDESLSAFNPGSIVSRINRGEDPEADEAFRQVFAMSQRVCSISGGAFDPTLGLVVDAYGFGRTGAGSLPSQAEIDSLMAGVGILDCGISPYGHVARKTPLTSFDFSAIAKGHAVDCIAGMLRRNGVSDYMVEIGGEISVAGLNPQGKPWRIMLEYPSENAGAPGKEGIAVIELTDCAIATSGNYRRHREENGKSASHIIDATTGLPSPRTTVEATVIAPTCALADALATACMAMPPADALEMVGNLPEAEAMVVSHLSGDSLKMAFTPGFARLL